MLEDSERNLWCGDQSRGLVEFRPDGRTLRFTHEDGLPSLAIRALFEDRENNVWVGTHGGGMTRFRHRAAYLFHEASNRTRRRSTPWQRQRQAGCWWQLMRVA